MLGFEIADHISSSPISERVENQSQIARELYWEMILYLRLSGLLELLLVMERSLNLQMDSDPNQLQGKRLMHTHTHTHAHTRTGLYTCLNSAFSFLAALGPCCRARASSSCGKQGLLFHCDARASRCGGFSCRAQALGTQASGVEVHGLSSCGTRAQLL